MHSLKVIDYSFNVCLQEFSFLSHLCSSTDSLILSLFTGLGFIAIYFFFFDAQSIPDLYSKSHSSFSVLPTHPHDSLFYGTICPRPILDFLCLLVLACRQWGFCRDCLGLCSPGLILVMSSPHRNSLFAARVVAGLVPVVLRIVRHVLATTIRDLWNAKVYHSHAPEGTRHPGVTQWGPGWRERAHE